MDGPVTTLIAGPSPDLVEFAKELGKRKERIALLSRNPKRLESFRHRLESADIPCESLTADVTESSSVVTAFKKLAGWSPRLDRLIYNVGVVSGETAITVNESELARVMSTNFFGFVNCFQLAHAMFRRSGVGHAIVISSTDALNPENASVAYGASKAALQIYLSSVRRETEGTVKISEVYLGRIPVNGSDYRWLTCEEIIEGLMRVIELTPDRYVIGER